MTNLNNPFNFYLMNTNIPRLVFGAAAIAALFAVSPSLRAEEKEKAEIPPSVLKRYDKNKNGALEEAEIAKWEADKAAAREKRKAEREAMLAKYDLNKDGRLSAEERAEAKIAMQEDNSEREAARMKERAAKLKAEQEAAATGAGSTEKAADGAEKTKSTGPLPASEEMMSGDTMMEK